MRIATVALLFALASASVLAEDPRPTASFRNEHVEIKKHLEHVREWAGQLEAKPGEQQRETAQQILTFFQKHLAPHAEWEERVLYPAIDALASGRQRFTESMRHDHSVVARWISDLGNLLEKEHPDYRAFVRRTDNLLGLVEAHFEAEEDVLLELADKKLTREQFESAVSRDKPAHGGH